jgi:hypothetical protein
MWTHDATVAADAGIKAAGQYDASVGLVVAERKVYECLGRKPISLATVKNVVY